VGSIALWVAAAALFAAAGWLAFAPPRPTPVPDFGAVEELARSAYTDAEVDRLLEQNLRMQEAILAAQEIGFHAVLDGIGGMQIRLGRDLAQVCLLAFGALFLLLSAQLLRPRAVKLHNHSLAQLEGLLWSSWVARPREGAGGGAEFELRPPTYPVPLCGCSSSGAPVHLCGCDSGDLPVHLCRCGCWTSSSGPEGDREKRDDDSRGGVSAPVHLCRCDRE